MANEAILISGSTLTLEASGTAISDGDVFECNDDDRQSTDNAGYPLGVFEFSTAATPFSGTPGASGVLHIFEQKINTAGSDAPDVVTSTYEHDYVWTWTVANSNTGAQNFTSPPVPLNKTGGKYWVKWVPTTAAVSVASGWSMKLTPVTYGT